MSPIIEDVNGYREDSTKGTASPVYYCANSVNQYKYLDDASGTCPTPPSPTETFTHDKDGNVIEDGDFDYTWDAENRLISATPKSPSNGDEKVVFSYDYMNRRVRKEVYVYASGWPQTPDEDWRFVYDQWNVILVLDGTASNATERKYTWGLDLSGLSGNASASGVHGAGGIGGLLAVEETATTGSPEYWFFYDANGNVGQVVNHATGYAVAAHYEYDPYGNVILADDADSSGYVDVNPIRFSTKWFDTETGLGYWGYRYYFPRLGRWMNRDPIEELGGSNLYSFTFNQPVLGIDLHGRSFWLWICRGLGPKTCPPPPGSWGKQCLPDEHKKPPRDYHPCNGLSDSECCELFGVQCGWA